MALEMDEALLLMDERLGRETAVHMGVLCVGLVGVLVEARHKALIRDLKTYLDSLRDVAGFRLSDELYAKVLRDAQEG